MKKYCLDGEIASFDYHSPSGLWSFCGPKSLKAFLDGCKRGERVEIEINSPGGSVVAGVEMANLVKNSGAHCVAHVVGIAASMASVIACACDEIVMEEASFMMIHDPWGSIDGNADEMRKEAKLLDQMKAVIMSFYRGKFEGKTDDEISALMSDETWYTGSECLANGLRCTVQPSGERIAAKIGARNFGKMPEAVKALYSFETMPDDVRAEVEAAAAAARASEGSPAPSGTSETDAARTPKQEEPQAPTAQAQETIEEPRGESVPSDGNDTTTASDWEARYKGASKKINELTAKLADVEDTAKAKIAELSGKVSQMEKTDGENVQKIVALQREIENFNSQIKDAGYENLGALVGAVSGFKAELEKSAKDLAESREQLEHMKSTRDVLTAGVLCAPESKSYEEKMKAAKTVDEREKLRAQKKAGKIK